MSECLWMLVGFAMGVVTVYAGRMVSREDYNPHDENPNQCPLCKWNGGYHADDCANQTCPRCERLEALLREGAEGFGRVLVATSDDKAVRDWQKRSRAALAAAEPEKPKCFVCERLEKAILRFAEANMRSQHTFDDADDAVEVAIDWEEAIASMFSEAGITYDLQHAKVTQAALAAPEPENAVRCACGHYHSADSDYEDAGCQSDSCPCVKWSAPKPPKCEVCKGVRTTYEYNLATDSHYFKPCPRCGGGR